MTVAEAIAAKANLEAILGSGIAESGHGDKRVKMQSRDDIIKEINRLDVIIKGVNNARPRAGAIRFRGC